MRNGNNRLYGELLRRDVLETAMSAVAGNAGAAGVDGQECTAYTRSDEAWQQRRDRLLEELQARTYRPGPGAVWTGTSGTPNGARVTRNRPERRANDPKPRSSGASGEVSGARPDPAGAKSDSTRARPVSTGTSCLPAGPRCDPTGTRCGPKGRFASQAGASCVWPGRDASRPDRDAIQRDRDAIQRGEGRPNGAKSDSRCRNTRSGNASSSPFIRSIFPCRTGLRRKGKNFYRRERSKQRPGLSSFPWFPSVQLPAGAVAQWLFMPEPDTRNPVSIRNPGNHEPAFLLHSWIPHSG